MLSFAASHFPGLVMDLYTSVIVLVLSSWKPEGLCSLHGARMGGLGMDPRPSGGATAEGIISVVDCNNWIDSHMSFPVFIIY